MQGLIVVNPQNEFSPRGNRPVHNHAAVLEKIIQRVEEARRENIPIAWCKHYNKPREAKAFVPKSWGAEFSPGLTPLAGNGFERVFTKDLYGAFTFTGLQEWLTALGVDEVVVVGFSTHKCVSTTVREALVRGFETYVDCFATGACPLHHEFLGTLPAEEVHRSALMHLADMGAHIVVTEASFSAMNSFLSNETEQLSQS